MARPRYGAVVFDFDGVIVDSTRLKLDAFATLYRPHGAAVVAAVTAYQRHHGGLSRFLKFKHFEEELLGRPLSGERMSELSARYNALVEDAVGAAPAVPGAEEALRALSGTLPLFVASGTPEEELRRIVERRGLAGYFTDVRGAPRVKEDLVGDIVAGHGLDAARTLMVGDAITDHDAAAAHGLPFLGVVPAGEEDPFPPGTPTVPDLHGLAERVLG
ncbi:HAD family hydrolase [Azospirillum sp. ST 5-10]|uniref:HAD family hydrolase n=1 Tax=unclassified Azospirillum TaxID=2630922 RepID=UPI003F49BC19